jgi:ferric iron reductase protein FhuF
MVAVSRPTVLLFAEADRAFQPQENAFAFRFHRDARRPTFHNFQRNEAEQG